MASCVRVSACRQSANSRSVWAFHAPPCERRSATCKSAVCWQAKQGQDQTYWWVKIFDSEEFWTNINIDIGQFAFNIAHSAAAREGLEHNKEIVEDIYINAKLGVLAGMFEKASQATAPGDCHPVVWNAMNFFNMGVRDMEGRAKIPESSLEYEYGYRYGYPRYYGANYKPYASKDSAIGRYTPRPDDLARIEREELFEHIKGKRFKEELKYQQDTKA